jgi:hypothetical protein
MKCPSYKNFPPWKFPDIFDEGGRVYFISRPIIYLLDVFTVVPIEAFRKMLTNSFPNLKEHLWTIPQQLDKFLKKFLTSCFIDQSDCSKIEFDWSMKQEVRNFLRNLSNCWGIVQRCSFKLGNIGTTVIHRFFPHLHSTFAKFLSRIFPFQTPYSDRFFGRVSGR